MSRHRNAPPRFRSAVASVAAVAALTGLLVLSATDPFGSDADNADDAVTSGSEVIDPATAEPPTETAPTTPRPTAPPTEEATEQVTEPVTPRRPGIRQAELRRVLRRQVEQQLRASGLLPVTTDGPAGQVVAPLGVSVDGEIGMAVANIPNRTSSSGWGRSVGTLVAGRPDFVSLNEVSSRSNEGIAAVAPGYGVHRAAEPDYSRGAAGQALNNAILYRTDTWTLRAGGMVRVVDDDRGYHQGRSFVWDRFAVWATLQREDGAVVSVISTHMPTNPGKFPQQPPGTGGSRAGRYAAGMDSIVGLVGQLSAYGPVLVAGDMNSHPGQGSWTAASKMGAAGYQYVKDQGVMYLFFGGGVSAVSSQQVRVDSDHPALLARLSMNGVGPLTS